MTANLTSREREVLRLAARGLENAEIARDLFLSENTVKTHLRRAFQKLGAVSRAHAVAEGYERGVLLTGAVRAALSARSLLAAFGDGRGCVECRQWAAARLVVAELDAAVAGAR